MGAKVLSYCLFPELHGTVDNNRYHRSVGVSCPAIFRTLLPFSKVFCRFSRKWLCLRLMKVKRPLISFGYVLYRMLNPVSVMGNAVVI